MRPSRVVLVLAVLLVLFEGGVRWVDAPPVAALRRAIDPAAAREYAPLASHPYLAYANRPGWRAPETPDGRPGAAHGALGFRGPDVSLSATTDARRIVCLGGSGTYGASLAAGSAWPALLAAELRTRHPGAAPEVINAGTRGYTTFELLIDFALRVADLEPDVVVVRPDVDDARSLAVAAPARDNAHWRAIWRDSAPTVAERVLGWSWTWRAARALLTGSSGDPADRLVHPDAVVASPAPGGARSAGRNLEHLGVLAAARGARLVLVTRSPGPGAANEAATRLLNDELRALAARTDALCVDVGRTAGGALVDADGLPTDAGAARIAAEVARALADAGLTGDRP